MERRLNKKIEDYLIVFKNDVAKKLQQMVNGLEISEAATRDELMRAIDEKKTR